MIHIAYIDPDETGRFTFEQIAVLLRARGIANEVAFYESLDGALRKLSALRPHLAFVDLRARNHTSPGDGATLVRNLRSLPLCRHTVIVGMARYAMPGDEASSRAAGCHDFLPKPVRYQAVEDLIVHHLLVRAVL